MDENAVIEKPIKQKSLLDINNMKESKAEEIELLAENPEYKKLDELYDECLNYLRNENMEVITSEDGNTDLAECHVDVDYESIEENEEVEEIPKPKMIYTIENEHKLNGSITSVVSEPRSDRLRKLSQQLPKIIITQSNSSLNVRRHDNVVVKYDFNVPRNDVIENERNGGKKEKMVHVPHWKKTPGSNNVIHTKRPLNRARAGYGDFPKRLVSKKGIENVALISNVPFEKIRLLNDTFHTLINLRWRWIVTGTIVVHFAIWLVFAVFWYITALAHYDFEPDPPKRTCVTGGHDFLTIFLASVEAQTTIGFGDRAIDEECPESIFLFIMQLILGTGLSGVLTCVVYAKLTRPEKLSRDGVGFSKKAVVSLRDGQLCLMLRAWDLNYDHIISSEFTAHFVHTHRTKEGETIRFYAQSLTLQQRQFLLWPVTLVHVIDNTSPLYKYGPESIANSNYEITVSLKGASASVGTFTQSQTSYMPEEVEWGHRFPPVVKYDTRKRKYAIEHKKLDVTEPVDTPYCSAEELLKTPEDITEPHARPGTPSSFSDQISSFQLGRSSSFRNKSTKG